MTPMLGALELGQSAEEIVTETPLNEDTLNIEIRKFLKQVGVTAQREIERAVREAVAQRRLALPQEVPVRARVTIEALGLEHTVEGRLALD